MATVTGGPERFNVWIREMTGNRIPGWAEGVQKKVFLQVGDQLVRGTPVGDPSYWKSPPPPGYTGGRARGGWQPTVGREAPRDINRISKTGAEPIAEGLAIAADAELGQAMFWTNSTPYILRLAHGWSRQAPNGWVPAALRKIVNQFKV